MERLAQKKRSFKEIETSKLRISRNQMRRKDTDTGIEQLAESIRKMGLLEPIIVSRIDERDDHSYEVIAGQRRFLACTSLDWKKIPCMVFDEPISDDIDSLTFSVSENVMRLDPVERDLIDACTKLYNHYGSIKMVSEETGLPRHKVSKYVKAARLSEPLKRMLDDGKLTLKTALSAEDASVENPSFAEKIAEKMVEEEMTPTNVEGFAKKVKSLVFEKGPENITIDDIDRIAADKSIMEASLTIMLSPELDKGLGDYAQVAGTNKRHAGRDLIYEGLVSKGFLKDVE